MRWNHGWTRMHTEVDGKHFAAVLLLGVAFTCAAMPAHGTPARPSAGCSAATIESGRGVRRTIEVDGVTRAYILDVPERIHPKQPVALLFDFHGFLHSAAGVWQVSGFRELAAADGFITVYPDGLPVHLLGREGPGWEIFTTD